MRLRRMRAVGFQSFADSGSIEFGEGINLIIGQNNSGKSALLRALQTNPPADPHRSPGRFHDYELQSPVIEMDIECSGAELTTGVLKRPNDHFRILGPRADTEINVSMLFNAPPTIFRLERPLPRGFVERDEPSHSLFALTNERGYTMDVTTQQGKLVLGAKRNSPVNDLAPLIGHLWNDNMFLFSPERFGIGKGAQGHATRLLSDARNLPAVLQTLAGTRGSLFARLVEHLREIFPTFGNLSVRPSRDDANVVEIRVWPTHEMFHPELSFALESSGTGVAQVISILTAIMTASESVIIVDEINSFLHPAAAKALLRIIQTTYPSHQYIISTHAPEVISFSNPSRLHLVKRSGYTSSVEELRLSDVGAFREVASHLGISMTDVFAANRVVWVEGQTEELCFPYLFKELIGALPQGLLMLSVAATGDFIAKKRDRELVYDVYSRLSSASANLTVTVAFSFDAEELSEAEMDDMRRESKGLVHFLPRRHFECYLLDVEAITDFINSSPSGMVQVSATQVADKLRQLANSARFRPGAWTGDLENEEWLARVDAARLIDETVRDLTSQTITFSKDDSLKLAKFLLSHKRAKLHGLSCYLQTLVH